MYNYDKSVNFSVVDPPIFVLCGRVLERQPFACDRGSSLSRRKRVSNYLIYERGEELASVPCAREGELKDRLMPSNELKIIRHILLDTLCVLRTTGCICARTKEE